MMSVSYLRFNIHDADNVAIFGEPVSQKWGGKGFLAYIEDSSARCSIKRCGFFMSNLNVRRLSKWELFLLFLKISFFIKKIKKNLNVVNYI